MGDYLLNFNGEKTVGLYNFKTDKLLTNDLKNSKDEIVGQMEKKMKAVIQQYNNRMIDNRLIVR